MLEYNEAHAEYFSLTIGNAPWPTMLGSKSTNYIYTYILRGLHIHTAYSYLYSVVITLPSIQYSTDLFDFDFAFDLVPRYVSLLVHSQSVRVCLFIDLSGTYTCIHVYSFEKKKRKRGKGREQGDALALRLATRRSRFGRKRPPGSGAPGRSVARSGDPTYIHNSF